MSKNTQRFLKLDVFHYIKVLSQFLSYNTSYSQVSNEFGSDHSHLKILWE